MWHVARAVWHVACAWQCPWAGISEWLASVYEGRWRATGGALARARPTSDDEQRPLPLSGQCAHELRALGEQGA